MLLGPLQKQGVLVEVDLWNRFLKEQPRMTCWVCLLDLAEHTKAQFACILELLQLGLTPSSMDLQIPTLFLLSIVSKPVQEFIRKIKEHYFLAHQSEKLITVLNK